ncbi:AI-2E family transporter [Shouchella lonarensis]|uniref:Predicted PurR-regulated permease PerM n=1 Tax=Shouchella lonarensis TaxID=1464122 RepID=A0A1G6JL03_9BACI|nr:AI-2E family transporter [Shouchella lonarensis]SDC19393.1 Predicted PurR-regulated permease PerM [Shouchella lonarensis]
MNNEQHIINLLKWTKWLIIALLFLIASRLMPFFHPVWDVICTLFWPICVAGLFAYLLHPIIEKLVHIGMSRTWAVVSLFVTFIVVTGAVVFFGVPILIRQITEAIDVLPGQLAEFEKLLLHVQHTVDRLPEPVDDYMDDWTGRLEGWSAQALDLMEQGLLRVAQSMIVWLVVPFLVFYLLKDYTLLVRVSYYLTPRRWRKPLHQYVHEVDVTFGAYIRGQLFVALCVGMLSVIAFWLLGIPYSLILGLFIGATDLIPYFGAFIGAAPAVVVAFMSSPTLALYTIIVIFVIQQIEGNVLSPVIVGRTVHLHPVFIILALLIGVEVAGIIGLLVAVPILAIVKVTLLHVRKYIDQAGDKV